MNDYYRKWYDENKEAVAKRRKEKYDNDPSYRQKHIDHSRRYYWLKRRRAKPLKKVDVNVDEIQPNEIADVIISNEDDVRCGIIVPVPMYYPRVIAKYIGRTVQTLRLWALQGKIPEATYRNFANYRLYTRDQFKIYMDNLPYLAFTSKSFIESPFFVNIREGIEALEPDGIEIMHKDEWKVVDERCLWCNGEQALYYLDVDWTPVPCFDCMNPYLIEDRKQVKEKEVVGNCQFCNQKVTNMQHVVGNITLICPDCGRRIPDAKVKE